MSESKMNETAVNISGISYDRQSASTYKHMDEQMQRIEDKVNQKIAKGMKKAIHLIVSKFDEMYQQKMTLFVKDEIDIKLVDIRKEVDSLKELVKKQASQMDAMSQKTKNTSNGNKGSKKGSNRYINSPPEITKSMETGMSQFESSQCQQKAEKSENDLNLAIAKDATPGSKQKGEQGGNDRKKRMNQILKKVSNNGDDPVPRKQSPDECNSLYRPSTLKELAKSQIENNMDKSFQFKSQMSNPMNKSTMALPKNNSSKNLRKKSGGNQSQKPSLHPEVKKQASKKQGKEKAEKKVEVSDLEEPQKEHKHRRKGSQINKYLEIIKKNSDEGPLLKMEIEKTVDKSDLDLLNKSIRNNHHPERINVSKVNVSNKKKGPSVTARDKKEKAKKNNESVGPDKADKKSSQQPENEFRNSFARSARNSFSKTNTAEQQQIGKAGSTQADLNQSLQMPVAVETKIETKVENKVETIVESKAEVKAESKPATRHPPRKCPPNIAQPRQNSQSNLHQRMPSIKGARMNKGMHRRSMSGVIPTNYFTVKQAEEEQVSIDIKDSKAQQKSELNEKTNTPVGSGVKQFTGVLGQQIYVDASMERRQDMPMNIITQPLQNGPDGQEYYEPTVVNQSFNMLTNDPSKMTTESTFANGEKSITTNERIKKITNDCMFDPNTGGQQFIVETQHLSMFINRKSIDQMASPKNEEQIAQQTEDEKSQVQTAEKKTETAKSPITFQSQEVVQNFQKEPVHMLTLSGNPEQKNKSTIYLTTTMEKTPDPAELMESLANFAGKQQNELLDKFIFKMFTGITPGSPVNIQSMIQELGQSSQNSITQFCMTDGVNPAIQPMVTEKEAEIKGIELVPENQPDQTPDLDESKEEVQETTQGEIQTDDIELVEDKDVKESNLEEPAPVIEDNELKDDAKDDEMDAAEQENQEREETNEEEEDTNAEEEITKQPLEEAMVDEKMESVEIQKSEQTGEDVQKSQDTPPQIEAEPIKIERPPSCAKVVEQRKEKSLKSSMVEQQKSTIESHMQNIEQILAETESSAPAAEQPTPQPDYPSQFNEDSSQQVDQCEVKQPTPSLKRQSSVQCHQTGNNSKKSKDSQRKSSVKRNSWNPKVSKMSNPITDTSDLNMMLSNESEDQEQEQEQQEPDTIPTPQVAPSPHQNPKPSFDQHNQSGAEGLKDLFVRQIESSETLPKSIHDNERSRPQTSLTTRSNNDLTDIVRTQSIMQDESHDADQKVSEFIAMNRNKTNDQQIHQVLEENFYKEQLQIDSSRNSAHKRYSTQHMMPTPIEGGPKNSIEQMSGADCEDDHLRQSLQILNIDNGNCQSMHVPLPQITEPPMKTPEPKQQHAGEKTKRRDGSKSQRGGDGHGHKTKRGESKSKANKGHARNTSQVSKKGATFLPPRQNPNKNDVDTSLSGQPSQSFVQSSLRPSQITSLKSSFIPEIPAKMAKVQDAVNRATSIVRENAISQRSQSSKHRRDAGSVGGHERQTKGLKGSGCMRQTSSSVSKTRQQVGGLAMQRNSSTTKLSHQRQPSTTKLTNQKNATSTKNRCSSSSKTKDKNFSASRQFNNLLLEAERDKFGDRCPPGFRKVGLLGKGGAAIVWLAEVTNTKKFPGLNMVALKQFPKTRGKIIDSSAKTEIDVGNILFPFVQKEGSDGSKSSDFERVPAMDKNDHPGMGSIAQFIDQIDDARDIWLVYEVGPACLRKVLNDVKGEFFKGERIYKVQHLQFYNRLLTSKQALRSFIIKVAEALDVLQNFGIVHSDLKPDNILVEMNQNYSDVNSIKIIDFGTSFQFYKATQVAATTPEYLAPEILKFLDDRNSPQKVSQQIVAKCKPWSFDVWSLGIILLEIASGCPVWMSLKCRVLTTDGKNNLCNGLFGVQQREVKKIMARQQQVMKSLPSTLRKFECYGLDEDPLFLDLLQRTLCEDPAQRLSPQDIINHKFCQMQD